MRFTKCAMASVSGIAWATSVTSMIRDVSGAGGRKSQRVRSQKRPDVHRALRSHLQPTSARSSLGACWSWQRRSSASSDYCRALAGTGTADILNKRASWNRNCWPWVNRITHTNLIDDVLIYPKRLPTDIRHNSKIFGSSCSMGRRATESTFEAQVKWTFSRKQKLIIARRITARCNGCVHAR